MGSNEPSLPRVENQLKQEPEEASSTLQDKQSCLTKHREVIITYGIELHKVS